MAVMPFPFLIAVANLLIMHIIFNDYSFLLIDTVLDKDLGTFML